MSNYDLALTTGPLSQNTQQIQNAINVAAVANSIESGEVLGESITSEGGDFLFDYSHIGIIAHIMKLLTFKVLNLEE